MLKIWGRADGSNVIKAMWCIGELGIAHQRIDWGGEFGGNDDPEYRRKNPNGRLPTLEEEDGWTLWESGAVVRYLCMKHSECRVGTLYVPTRCVPCQLRSRKDILSYADFLPRRYPPAAQTPPPSTPKSPPCKSGNTSPWSRPPHTSRVSRHPAD